LFAAVIHFPLDRAFVLQEEHQRRLRQAAVQRRKPRGFLRAEWRPFPSGRQTDLVRTGRR
jgi:hypothetical protein